MLAIKVGDFAIWIKFFERADGEVGFIDYEGGDHSLNH